MTYDADGAPNTVHIRIAPASPLLTSDAVYSASFKAIFALFILAVLIESGLALILRWRPFVSYFDSRTVNAVVAFVVSYVFATISISTLRAN